MVLEILGGFEGVLVPQRIEPTGPCPETAGLARLKLWRGTPAMKNRSDSSAATYISPDSVQRSTIALNRVAPNRVDARAGART